MHVSHCGKRQGQAAIRSSWCSSWSFGVSFMVLQGHEQFFVQRTCFFQIKASKFDTIRSNFLRDQISVYAQSKNNISTSRRRACSGQMLAVRFLTTCFGHLPLPPLLLPRPRTLEATPSERRSPHLVPLSLSAMSLSLFKKASHGASQYRLEC